MTSQRRRNLNTSRQIQTSIVRARRLALRQRTWLPLPVAARPAARPASASASPRRRSLAAAWRLVVARRSCSGSGPSATSASSRGRAAIGSVRSSPTGPFALVRNPLYLGNIALWVGFALSARLVWLAPIIVLRARRSSTTRSCGGKSGCSRRASATTTARTPRACRDGSHRSARQPLHSRSRGARSRGARRSSASAGRFWRSRRVSAALDAEHALNAKR